MRYLTLFTAMLIGCSASPLLAADARPALVSAIPSLSAEGARVALDAAEQVARAKGWRICIAVVDAAGDLLAFRRMDGTMLVSVDAAIDKARTSARTAMVSGQLQDMVDSGAASVLAVRGLTPLRGGVPIIVGGQVVGAIAGSGAAAVDDEIAAKAGAAAISGALDR